MIPLIIYLIGYVLTYLIGRYIVRRIQGDDYDWLDVRKLLFISLATYFTLFIWGVVLLYWYIEEYIDKRKVSEPKTPTKPPYWL